MSGVAVLVDGEWIALGTRIVLADSASTRSPLGKPVMRSEGVVAFRVAMPVSELRSLMSEVAQGQIAARRLGRGGVAIKTWCPPGVRPTSLSFTDYINASWVDLKTEAPEGWPRIELTLRGGQLSEWAGNDTRRYEALGEMERRFKARRFGSVLELAARLGLRFNATDFIHTPAQHWLSAVLPARLASVQHDRARDDIVATVQVGRLVPRGRLRVGLSQADGRPPRPSSVIPAKGRLVRVRIPKPTPGSAEVSLEYGGIGVIGALKVEVKPPLRSWPRFAALSLIDDGLKQLRTDLASTKPELQERGVALFLELLGFASLWWTRSLVQPSGSKSGRHAQDIVAFSGGDRQCLVVECKTDWLSEAKINTLVGRTNAMAHRLDKEAPGEPPATRALLAVARPRHETPLAVKEAIRKNRAGLITLDDATELLEMMERRLPVKEVRARFEQLFDSESAGVYLWDAEWT